MSADFPCIYFEPDGKCRKFSSDVDFSYCVLGPCPEQKLSNADLIRAMSHDNLLNFFVELVGNMGCSPNRPFPCFKCDEDGYDECRKCWGEYLQQPAEEEDT